MSKKPIVNNVKLSNQKPAIEELATLLGTMPLAEDYINDLIAAAEQIRDLPLMSKITVTERYLRFSANDFDEMFSLLSNMLAIHACDFIIDGGGKLNELDLLLEAINENVRLNYEERKNRKVQ